MKFLLLEKLGIPRLRINGISIFNVFGTMTVAYALTCIDFVSDIIDFFQMSCLLISLAVVVHYILGDYTPLVKLVMTEKIWRCYFLTLVMTGFIGTYFLKCMFLLFTGFMLMKDNVMLKKLCNKLNCVC